MKKLATLPETAPLAGKQPQFTPEYWFDDACILDMDYFVKTLTTLKTKGVRPDLIGSIIAHYASKWLPDLTGEDNSNTNLQIIDDSSESVTSSWLKKKYYVETLVGILPPEMNSVSCNFLLRVLRVANMVNVEATYLDELEKRISWQLDQASLKEIMIPLFSHNTCDTLLDIELVTRLANRFIANFDECGDSSSSKSGGLALLKVAKVVDCYLAEVAADSNLKLSEFVALSVAIPCHARATDDGLYRAIDTYLKVIVVSQSPVDLLEGLRRLEPPRLFKLTSIVLNLISTQNQLAMRGEKSQAHPNVTKQERKNLCTLIDNRKLSPEASLHAAQNERLPVRSIIQVIFSEQNKINRNIDWNSSSFGRNRSPMLGPTPPGLLEQLPPTARCPSKRQVSVQQMEIKKLKDDIVRLQTQCSFMQARIEKIEDKKRGCFGWVGKIFTPTFESHVATNIVHGNDFTGDGKVEAVQLVAMTKSKPVRIRTTPKRSSSVS